ncbi:transporter, cation channel family protein [Besnoitia besnoiti]|uniref:Transporter, cation channel family protein n=1 Tax=Besnoitia besnoiti TaxID=94643 RepID=A0A2A9M8J4_BESBE|nr:transporter, cation channel family protein [Besnoitia besnoiti]PFH32631.1 transporter, cation channel family protein [Besnoitia besnoiti]
MLQKTLFALFEQGLRVGGALVSALRFIRRRLLLSLRVRKKIFVVSLLFVLLDRVFAVKAPKFLSRGEQKAGKREAAPPASESASASSAGGRDATTAAAPEADGGDAEGDSGGGASEQSAKTTQTIKRSQTQAGRDKRAGECFAEERGEKTGKGAERRSREETPRRAPLEATAAQGREGGPHRGDGWGEETAQGEQASPRAADAPQDNQESADASRQAWTVEAAAERQTGREGEARFARSEHAFVRRQLTAGAVASPSS